MAQGVQARAVARWANPLTVMPLVPVFFLNTELSFQIFSGLMAWSQRKLPLSLLLVQIGVKAETLEILMTFSYLKEKNYGVDGRSSYLLFACAKAR
jgi:hypothetical protein